jgi:RNA polymerase sigma-70 factor, ECF subfamily
MAESQAGGKVAQLVADHHEAVYRYAYRLSGSVQDAEDLTQRTYLAAHRKIGQLRRMDRSKAWLFAILRNCFLKDRQRRGLSLAVDLALDMDLVPSAPPKEAVDSDRLQEALNRLPEIFRLVVVMFYFEECSYREVAQRLGLPIGTVMSRLSRAKDYLRSSLFEPEPGTHQRPTRVAIERG